MRKKQAKREQGFTLIEILVAIVILLLGLLSVAGLMGVAIRSNVASKNLTSATTLAQDKLENLKSLHLTSNPQVQVGGSLDANVGNYFDTLTGYTRRWTVVAGTVNLREITVRVIPNRVDNMNKVVEVKTIAKR